MSALQRAQQAIAHNPVWTRLPGDTDRSFAAFVVYRDLPANERTLAKAAEVSGEKQRTVEEWSAEQGWGIRVAAYEAYLDQQRMKARLKEIEQMEERHAAAAAAGLAALTLPIAALARPRSIGGPNGGQVRRMDELEAMPSDVLLRLAARSANAIARLVGVERISRGEPTELVGLGGQPAPAPPPDDDESRMRRIFAALEESGQIRGLELGDVLLGEVVDVEDVPADGG